MMAWAIARIFARITGRPTLEEQAEEGKRSTAIGFFNQAASYWQAARALDEAKLNATHGDDPIFFLYFHAVELYLKAFLRAHDITPYELRRKYGHDTKKLSKKATKFGLRFSQQDTEIFWFISKTTLGHRYLVTGLIRRLQKKCCKRNVRALALLSWQRSKSEGHPARPLSGRAARSMKNDPILNVRPDCLMFFVDETGHESFADPDYPVFGLGGCAVLAGNIDHLLRAPWRAMKDHHFGGRMFACMPARSGTLRPNKSWRSPRSSASSLSSASP